MRVETQTSVLTQALASVQGFTTANTVIAAYAGVLLCADQDGLSLRTMGPDISVWASAKAIVLAEGQVGIQARQARAILSKLAPGRLVIQTEGTSVAFETEQCRFTLPAISASEFPAPLASDEDCGALPMEALAEAVRRVAPCASRETFRPMLAAVNFRVFAEAGFGYLRMAATDGYRYAELTRGLENCDFRGELQALIPAKALTDAVRVLEKRTKTVTLGIARHDAVPNRLFISGDDFSVALRLMDGEFPNIEGRLPGDDAFVLELPGRLALLRVVEQAGLIAGKKSCIRLKLQRDNVLVCASSDSGSYSASVPASYDGPEMTVGFNPQFLSCALDLVDTPGLLLRFKSALGPFLFYPDDSQRNYRHLLMPVRLGQ